MSPARALARRIGARFAAEASVPFYALVGPFLRPPSPPQERPFAAAPGAGGILFGFLVLVAAETVAMHLVVARYSTLAAWALTALSIYTALWLAADYELLRLRPVALTADTLRVRVGLRFRADIARARVVALEGPPREGDGSLDLSTSGAPTCTLVLDGPVEVKGPFGIVRKASRLALQLDDPAALGRALHETPEAREKA